MLCNPYGSCSVLRSDAVSGYMAHVADGLSSSPGSGSRRLYLSSKDFQLLLDMSTRFSSAPRPLYYRQMGKRKKLLSAEGNTKPHDPAPQHLRIRKSRSSLKIPPTAPMRTSCPGVPRQARKPGLWRWARPNALFGHGSGAVTA